MNPNSEQFEETKTAQIHSSQDIPWGQTQKGESTHLTSADQSSPMTESIPWDLTRDPSSDASSRASLSLCSITFLRIDGFLLTSSEEWLDPSLFLLFLSNIRAAQRDIGFHNERCMKAFFSVQSITQSMSKEELNKAPV
nr:hypothetical protein Iba_scaffold58391CG0010 [Ipomoea batatas]